MLATKRAGFNLVELLVTISILGLIAGLAMPAIGSIRESARVTSCRNNLRNIGIAMLQYEAANKAFPAGQDAPIPGESDWNPVMWDGHSGLGHLWFAFPYLEQSTIYGEFRPAMTDGNFWGNVPGLETASETELAILRCPSDVTFDVKSIYFSTLYIPALNNVAMISSPVAQGYQGWTNYLGSRGVPRFYRDREPAINTGIFYEQSSTRSADITDGMSNTILVGEVLGGITGESETRIVDNRHSIFQNGIGSRKLFFDETTGEFGLPWMFSSQHQGGHLINHVFCDGHVSSLTSDIEPEIIWAMSTRSGIYE